MPGGHGHFPWPPAAYLGSVGSTPARPRPRDEGTGPWAGGGFRGVVPPGQHRRRPAVKAASYDRYGPAAEVLEVRDVERPAPGPGEVLVKVTFSGVNPTDWKSRSGATPRPIDGFQIPHHDGAGV